MTVAELIERLGAEDSTVEVYIVDSEYGALDILSIRNNPNGNVMLESE